MGAPGVSHEEYVEKDHQETPVIMCMRSKKEERTDE